MLEYPELKALAAATCRKHGYLLRRVHLTRTGQRPTTAWAIYELETGLFEEVFEGESPLDNVLEYFDIFITY